MHCLEAWMLSKETQQGDMNISQHKKIVMILVKVSAGDTSVCLGS